MLKKFLIFALVVSCSAAIFAQDYNAGWKAAYKLYSAQKYAEAIPAFVKLAESTSEPGRQFRCYIYAGYSARNIKKYDEALAFADKAGKVDNPHKYNAMIRKLDFTYSSRKYQKVIDLFPISEIMKWPKCYRSNALYYIGLAQYNLKKGEDAEKTFKLGYENAEIPSWKAQSILRSGNNYRHLLKDADKAVESFRETIKINAHQNYTCEAYNGLAEIFIKRKKYDEALVEYDKLLAVKKISAYWKARGLYVKGNVLKTMGKKEEAIKCYKQSLSSKGCTGWIKTVCQKQLKALQAGKAE